MSYKASGGSSQKYFSFTLSSNLGLCAVIVLVAGIVAAALFFGEPKPEYRTQVTFAAICFAIIAAVAITLVCGQLVRSKKTKMASHG